MDYFRNIKNERFGTNDKLFLVFYRIGYANIQDHCRVWQRLPNPVFANKAVDYWRPETGKTRLVVCGNCDVVQPQNRRQYENRRAHGGIP